MADYRKYLAANYYDALDRELPIRIAQTAKPAESFLIADYNRDPGTDHQGHRDHSRPGTARRLYGRYHDIGQLTRRGTEA
ncbi:MAG TPA: hypothetical protein VL027_14140 [Spongiibacteraceae bacterium]|jgi:hypothetical protein|nr:hypothetical protein [Spongiibacteraceae bacterium]